MPNRHLLTILCVFFFFSPLWSQIVPDSVPSAPALAPPEIEVRHFGIDAIHEDTVWRLFFTQTGPNGRFRLSLNGQEEEIVFSQGRSRQAVDISSEQSLVLINWQYGEVERYRLYHFSQLPNGSTRVRHIPLWLSILPPLVAIGLALVFREVMISLFAGIWTGSFIAAGMRVDSLYQILLSFWRTLDHYIVTALADTDHLAVLLFSMIIGGMVAVISRNGGMAGVVLQLSRLARTDRSAQFVTWLLGLAIFFDDYANTLIVGNTMRSVTDRFRISREKLAYVVDSTAAPVVAVAFVTTWIGAELGYIEDGISQLQNFNYEISPYAIFLSSLKYSFYPFLTILFILMIIYTGKDYGPMYKAEVRARRTGQVSSALTPEEDEPDMEDLTPVKGAPKKWQYAVLPILTVIFMTLFGLLETGMQSTWAQLREGGYLVGAQSWGEVWRASEQILGPEAGFFRKLGLLIGNSNSYTALLWASLSGLALAIVMTISSRIMNLFYTIDTMIRGFKSLMPAVLILTLAWSLALTTEELHTATYLTSIVEGNINAMAVPMLIFVLAALISFSTGSSWSTMAILYPIAIPTTWAVCQAQGLDDPHSLEILLNVISVVLAASVLGDHCSPISDTTILSSLASDCNHIDHVRTQLPYALTVGSVSLAAAGITAYTGGGWGISGICFVVGLVVLYGVVHFVGRRI